MKHLSHAIILVFFLLSSLSCSQYIMNRLDSIESIMDDQPDKALSLLEEISIEDLSSEESKARYFLLKSIALDKNYIDVQNDSLIRRAVDYYSVREQSLYRMKAWYYAGVVEANAGRFNTAIVSLEKADRDAEALEDYYYIGLINRKKASIYNSLINTPAAIECYQTALQAFQQANKNEHAAFCKLSLGIVWFNCSEYEKAKEIILEAKQESDNSYLIQQCELRLAAISIEKNEGIDSALGIYNVISTQFYDLYDYGYHAIAWELIGQKDSASVWMDRGYKVARNEADSASLDYMYSRIARMRGDDSNAFILLDHANRVQESNTVSILQESLTSALKDFYKESLAFEEAKAVQVRIKRIWEGVIGCLLLIFMVVLFRFRIKSKNRLLELQMARYQAVQKENRGIHLLNTQLVGSLFSERLHHIDQLSQEYFSADEKRKKDIVFSSFKRYLEEFRNDQDAFIVLESDLNRINSGIMERLVKQVPEISGDKRRFAALFFAGVPYETIQLIMKSVSIESLRMQRSRIRKAIKEADAVDAEEFLDMLEIKKRTAGNKTNEC